MRMVIAQSQADLSVLEFAKKPLKLPLDMCLQATSPPTYATVAGVEAFRKYLTNSFAQA